jgi:hypothetical protein
MNEKKLLIDLASTIRLQLNESQEGGSRYLFARGEFGRVDVPTQNKRVYPRKIWEREIQKIYEAMRSGKVLGELDHPCLLSNDFRVLTLEGWKEFKDIKVGDQIWSRVEGKAVVSYVDSVIDQPYSGPAVSVKGRSIDSAFTPKHKLLISKRPEYNNNSKDSYSTLEEICEHPSAYSHDGIPKTAKWDSNGKTKVTIPGIPTAFKNKSNNDTTQDLVLDAGLFASFMGIYLAEGSTSSEWYTVNIYQKTSWSRQFIYEEILSLFPSELKWNEQENGFFLSDARLHSYLKKLGNTYNKYVPDEIRNLDPEYLKEFIFWYAIGDGRMMSSLMITEEKSHKERLAESLREGHVAQTRTDLFSVSDKLIYGLFECVVKSGRSGVISKIFPDKDYQFADHVIKAENKVPLYQLHISSTDYIWVDPRHLMLELVQHNGNIYCLTTTYGNFYMEQNGKSFWTGNCSGKTSLKQVSHLMTGLALHDDGTIYGEAKILLNEHGNQLRSILEAGGAVGVSSRGMGSTSMNEAGYEVVQEDYSYMTHDFVADPAVLTSYPKFQTEVKWVEPQSVLSEKMENSMENQQDAKKLIEAEMQKKLDEQKTQLEETHKKQLEEAKATLLEEEKKKIQAEAQEAAKKTLEADPVYVASQMAFEDVKKAVRAFILPEDTEAVVRSKDKEIEALKEGMAQLEESKKASEKKLTEKIEQIGKVADRLAVHLHYYKKLSESEELKIKKHISNVKFESIQHVDSILETAGKKLAEENEYKAKLESIQKELETKYQTENKDLKDRVEKLDVALQESLKLNKELGIKTYVEERIRGNPNAPKIRGLCEGKMNRQEVDEIIKRFAVAPVVSEDYNAFRRRVSKVENTTLVEDQLKEAGNQRTQESKGVLGEDMKDLFCGATLDQVEALMK